MGEREGGAREWKREQVSVEGCVHVFTVASGALMFVAGSARVFTAECSC